LIVDQDERWNLLSLLISFIFKQMRKFPKRLFRLLVCAASVMFIAASATAQMRAPGPAKTIFRDSDGNLISNNEFVDIRMANFHYPDATIVKVLEDGTIEFRLQKVPQEGMMAPDFYARTLDGRTVSPADLNGKVIVLNFWFIGCPVCYAQKPKLNEFKAKFDGNSDVVFVAMTADSTGAVKKYLAKERFDYLQAADAGLAMGRFKFSGFPKNIVIGKDGRIAYWRSTIAAWDKFESVVRAELAAK
jgi:peroxiredoxin